MKALGFQPVGKYIPFKDLVSDVNLHPYSQAKSTAEFSVKITPKVDTESRLAAKYINKDTGRDAHTGALIGHSMLTQCM